MLTQLETSKAWQVSKMFSGKMCFCAFMVCWHSALWSPNQRFRTETQSWKKAERIIFGKKISIFKAEELSKWKHDTYWCKNKVEMRWNGKKRIIDSQLYIPVAGVTLYFMGENLMDTFLYARLYLDNEWIWGKEICLLGTGILPIETWNFENMLFPHRWLKFLF